MPFTLVALGAYTLVLGADDTVPLTVTVVTSYLCCCGIGVIQEIAKKGAAKSKPEHRPGSRGALAAGADASLSEMPHHHHHHHLAPHLSNDAGPIEAYRPLGA